jgi:hypothetical protein
MMKVPSMQLQSLKLLHVIRFLLRSHSDVVEGLIASWLSV